MIRGLIKRESVFLGIVLLTYLSVLPGLNRAQGTDDLSARYIRVLKLTSENKLDAAVSLCREMIEGGFYSENRIYPALIQASKENDDFHGALDYFRELRSRFPANPYYFYALGLCFQEMKQHRRASGYFLRSIERGAPFTDVYTRYVDSAEKSGKLGEAVRFFENRLLSSRADYLTLYGLGYVHQVKRDWEESLKYFQDALAVNKDFTEAFLSIGNVYIFLNRYDLAQENLMEGLKSAEKIADHDLEILFLNAIGTSYYYLSLFHEALKYYERVAALSESVYNRRGRVLSLANMGLMLIRLARYSQAMVYCREGLALVKDIGDEPLERSLYSFMGISYYEVGDFRRALDYYARSLALSQKLGDQYSQSGTYNEIGLTFLKTGDIKLALENLEMGLELAGKTGNSWVEGIILGNMGLAYSELNELNRAIDYCERSLVISRKIGYKRDEGYVLNFLGDTYFKKTDYPIASRYYKEALLLGEKINVPEIAWNAYRGMAACYERQGEYDLASQHYKSAIETIENVRTRLQTQEMKSDFLKDKIKIYESLIKLLITMHRYEEAFAVLEKSKARAFLDSLVDARVDLSKDVSIEQREREEAALNTIDEIQTLLLDANLSPSVRDELYRELLMAEEEYEFIKQEIRFESPNYASIVYPDPYGLKEVRSNLLGGKTALLEFMIGEEYAFAFFLSSESFHVFQLPDSKKLIRTVDYYLGLFSSPSSREFKGTAASRKLYIDIISPVEHELEDIEDLIIVPDGILYYLPFETLISGSGKAYLVEDFRISYAPSASSLINLFQRGDSGIPRKEVVGFGNPDYSLKTEGRKKDDKAAVSEYYLDSGFEFFPLYYSAKELRDAGRYFQKDASDFYLGRSASEDILKTIPLEDYKIIHFATHGLLDENVAGRSALVLTQDDDPAEDGFFQVREIYNLKLNADLVVLSACQTGRGELNKGEGVSGLARAFLYAGADSVLVSLWNINDKSTSLFMKYFYEHVSQNESKSEALRKAKLRMIQSRYRHPFYWAAFILIGDYEEALF